MLKYTWLLLLLPFLLLLFDFSDQEEAPVIKPKPERNMIVPPKKAVPPHIADIEKIISSNKALVIHVIVALCDNKHQGIVKVPADLGNGQDPKNNLYWGAMYGVRQFLKKKEGWHESGSIKLSPDSKILEKLILQKTMIRKGKPVNTFLVAEAWDGRYIKEATIRFLEYSAGLKPEYLRFSATGDLIPSGGRAHMLAYVGHNGLMDFALGNIELKPDGAVPQMVSVLACKSRKYFENIIPSVKGRSMLFTTGLMAPEAYTLAAIVTSWVKAKELPQISQSAAEAYSEYQKCSISAAQNLFSGKTD